MARNSRKGGFFQTFKETMFANVFNLGGLVAGFVIASQLGIFGLAPWALALYPAIVSAKGVIGGLLAGRLGTALHLGTVQPRFFKNTSGFYMLFQASVVVTLVTSITMSLISIVFGTLFWGITISDFATILSVVISTMAIGFFLSFITSGVAFFSFKKGLDPDVIVYPIMSTTADIFVTLCYVLILNLFFLVDFGGWITSSIALAFFLLTLYVLRKNFHEREFRKTIKESLVTMLFVSFIVNITGTVLRGISTVVENRKEIYMVYPALIDIVGDVGSVVGSTATTKLALGLLKPSFSSIRRHSTNILSSWAVSIILFCVLAVFSLFLTGNISLFTLSNLLLVLLLTNVISVLSIVFVSFGISILTFKRGLDPDNFVIPIESSIADGLTSMALFVVLVLVGAVS